MIHPCRSSEYQPQSMSNYTIKPPGPQAAPASKNAWQAGNSVPQEDKKQNKEKLRPAEEGRSIASAGGSFLINFDQTAFHRIITGGRPLFRAMSRWFCGSVALWLLWSSFDSLQLSSIDASSASFLLFTCSFSSKTPPCCCPQHNLPKVRNNHALSVLQKRRFAGAPYSKSRRHEIKEALPEKTQKIQ